MGFFSRGWSSMRRNGEGAAPVRLLVTCSLTSVLGQSIRQRVLGARIKALKWLKVEGSRFKGAEGEEGRKAKTI